MENTNVLDNLKNRRAVSYICLFAFLFLGFILLRGSTWQGSTQLHTLMELIATSLALFVGVVALVRYYTKKNNPILFIGVAFLGTALLDGYHTIVTSTFFDQFWPSPPPSLIPWSWNASRFFLSILMFLSWWVWRREEKLGEQGKIGEKNVYLATGLLTLGSFLFFAFYPLPRAYYPEFLFGRPEEFVSAFFFLLALIGYLKKGLWRNSNFEHWVVLSLIVGFMGQAMFMSSSFHLFDMMFDMAHLLKKVSYTCVLVGLLISMYFLFRRAEEVKQDKTQENKALQKEIVERKHMEVTLRRRESILEAVSTAAQKFMESSSWEEHVQDVLRGLGIAIEVSRVNVNRNHHGEKGEILSSRKYEWARSGVTSQINNVDFQELDLKAAGFGRWVDMLGSGESIHGFVKEFPASERESLAVQGIMSMVVVPIFVEEQWWGYISFEECLNERPWLTLELDALKVAAGTLGSAIQRERAEKRIEGLNSLKEELLSPCGLDKRLKLITDGVVEIFDADFARIWIIQPGDRCDIGCKHASVREEPHICRYKERCLHLMASSGRYSHIDGEVHRRVPFGCYKIGRVAAGDETKFVTNDVTHDPRVHDHDWAKQLGLVSFAGYRLQSPSGESIGVLALFSKTVISSEKDILLGDVANTISQIIQMTKTEDGLREMASFAKFNPAPVFRFNRAGEIVQVNPATYKIYDKERIESQKIKEILPPLSNIDVSEYIQEGRLDVLEVTINGKEFQFVVIGIPDLEVGNVYGSDITDRKFAEKIQSVLFRISEATSAASNLKNLFGIIHQQLSRLINTSNFYIALYDPGNDLYSFPYIVDEFDQETVFTPQQLRKSLTDYVRKTGEPLMIDEQGHKRLIQKGEVIMVGSPAAHWLGAPLKTSSGAIGVVAVQSYSDPSIYSEKDLELLTFVSDHIATAIERKRSEEDLRLFNFTIEHSSESMFWIGPDARFQQVNDFACDILGYSREELLSMKVFDIDPTLPEMGWPAHWEELREKGSLTFETIHRTKIGREFPVEVSANYLEYDGHEYHFTFARDITERKRIDLMKDEFISTVSHEIRTPLTSIHGSLDLLNKGMAGDLPEKSKNLVEIARRNSIRLRELIEDMLDIQKIESGKLEFDLKPLKVPQLVRFSLENNKSFGEQFNVEFVLDDAIPDVKVKGDKNRLAQVMDNLLSNAAKFSSPNSSIEVSVSRHNGSVRVAVRDHGSGIPEEFRDKIFGKFTQADSSSTRVRGGTGLGLNIAKSIVEKHGGKIGFETKIDEGTTFYFELPELRGSEGP
jgi:PAS domain S-box-containing protein